MAMTRAAVFPGRPLQLKAEGRNSARIDDGPIRPAPKKPSSSPLLCFSKPSWIVRTESHVRKEGRKKPHPPCVVCHGTGRVNCQFCSGFGRTNLVHMVMLPKGEWPKWCRTCGGSGLSDCCRCLGTGEYRYIMGFQFMNKSRDTQGPTAHFNNSSSADKLLNGG